jgi:hypothetical protein
MGASTWAAVQERVAGLAGDDLADEEEEEVGVVGPGGAPQAPSSAQRPQPEPQRKSSQPKLFNFSRRASREEVEEQAAERVEVIAVAAAEAKAAAEERAAGAPPKRPPGRPRKEKRERESKKTSTRVDYYYNRDITKKYFGPCESIKTICWPAGAKAK